MTADDDQARSRAGPLRLFFVTSVWTLLILCALQISVHVILAGDIATAYPWGYGIKVLIAPFVLFSIELFLWARMFRHPRPPARILAGLVGAYVLLANVLVAVLITDLYHRNVNDLILLGYLYAGTGHLSFALFGRDALS